MSKWARRLAWGGALFGGFLTASLVYAWFFGVQTFFALQTRNMARKAPILKSVPVELGDLAVSNSLGMKLSFQGAEFEVPWDDLDKQKTRIVGKCAAIYFRSGRSILLCVGAPDMFINGLAKDKTPDPDLFAKIYGPQVLHSDYTLYDALYKTTPSQITLATPSNRAKGAKGFQLGDPTRRPKRMCLELFTEDAECEINITQDGTGPTPPITQPELNRIIQTVQKAAHTQSILTVSPA